MANPILDYPISYRGFTINPERDTSGQIVRANNGDTIVLRRFDFSPMVVRDQIEGLHLEEGADVGVFTHEYRRVSLMGDLRGNDEEALADREARFLSAFDGAEAVRASPETEGVSALDFYCPTDAPPGGLSSPVHEMFLARPHGFPVSYQERSKGQQQRVAAELACPDPRRYIHTPTTVVYSAAAGWSHPLPNWPVGVGVLTYPLVNVEINDPPLNELHISDGTNELVLYLGTVGAGTLTVDMATGRITMLVLAGPPTFDAAWTRTSPVATSFFGVPPGGATWTMSGATDPGIPIVGATVVYRMARS